MTVARYHQPAIVGRYVMSETSLVPGSVAIKSRPTRSGEIATFLSGFVRLRRLRRVTPRMSRSRISRSTLLRDPRDAVRTSGRGVDLPDLGDQLVLLAAGLVRSRVVRLPALFPVGDKRDFQKLCVSRVTVIVRPRSWAVCARLRLHR